MPIHYLPYWHFSTQGKLFDRQVHQEINRRSRGFSKKFQPDSAIKNIPNEAKAVKEEFNFPFFVPAFETSEVVKLGAYYTIKQPALKETAGTAMYGGVIDEDEAREIADLIYIYLEASKPDFLKSIDFVLEISNPTIVAIPYALEDKKVKDLVSGFHVFKEWITCWDQIASIEK